ncbi:hypothetical protein FQN57_000576 [Myotisia sp. PD_48]|nr:hypothetical protein FQN57_000576 [Myotisia sp. PD_48]
MPAVLDSLVNQLGLKPHQAWRVAYVVPFSMIVLVALGMILFCDDSPSGRWCDRHFITKNCEISDCPSPASGSPTMSPSSTMDVSQPALMKQYAVEETTIYAESEHQGRDSQLNRVKAEIIVSPTVRQALRVIVSKESLVLATAYACSLGSSRWAAMMGLLNVVFRPLGGFIADVLYKKTKSIWAKKIWLTFVGISFSAFLLAVGFSNPKSHPTMVGLITGYAMFMAASNGANFALVPHVHPFANGIVSGLVGAFGNLGGILFSVVFRYYNSTDLHQSLWIIGAISLAINIATSWVAPIPESQIGGR